MPRRRRVKKISLGQFRAASEISGNLGVAWFAGGVIAPFLSSSGSLESVYLGILSFGLFVFFVILSLLLAGKTSDE